MKLPEIISALEEYTINIAGLQARLKPPSPQLNDAIQNLEIARALLRSSNFNVQELKRTVPPAELEAAYKGRA